MPHCKECGAKIVEDMMLCGSCGAEVSETSGTSKQRFCKDCGLQISPSRYIRHHGRCGPCSQKVRSVEYIGYVFLFGTVASCFFVGYFYSNPMHAYGLGPIQFIPAILICVGFLVSAFLIIYGRKRRKRLEEVKS